MNFQKLNFQYLEGQLLNFQFLTNQILNFNILNFQYFGKFNLALNFTNQWVVDGPTNTIQLVMQNVLKVLTYLQSSLFLKHFKVAVSRFKKSQMLWSSHPY